VLNLALNAQDAMPAGGQLTLGTELAVIDEDYHSLHPEVASGSYALISVTDDGEGMTPDIIDRAFEPFFTTKEVGKGSGLGLSMVYGFAKQSNGHVSIYSREGLGTTVRIYLPRADAGLAPNDLPESEEAAPRGYETILIAEDDPFVRSSAIRRVEALGYRVIAAVNGKEALQRLRSDPGIDMLFTDIVMPGGMSGWELADQARRIRPGLPVLFTSGYPLDTVVEQDRAHAHAVVLTKPYRKVELAQRLRDAFAAAVPTS
jgi:CheY-like chemotaxis protein